ncbi:MAG: Eco57I restriction-modification methylase domain-containing protein [Pyrinomonadaceae bacterium]
MLKTVDKIRSDVSSELNDQEKSRLGQFMTPASIAKFMASLFTFTSLNYCRLLDAGAGIGSLSSAFLDRLTKENNICNRLHIEAYEIDNNLITHLEKVFSCYNIITKDNLKVSSKIINEDFIEFAVNQIQFGNEKLFTHAILNPPYKKISSDSKHRLLLREAGIETVNLYSAFVALALELLQKRGQLVAIIPRSFCNGPYYKHFRTFLLNQSAIRQIHLFDARNKAFKDDEVLQENVIIFLERGGKQNKVTISTSTDDSFSDYAENFYEFTQIVNDSDIDKFIHIPKSKESNFLESSPVFDYLLSDSFIEVSTGPVVDFRVKEHTRKMPAPGTVPLLYPDHFVGNEIKYPKANWKKPNAISFNNATEKWLYPKGFYTVVRRFSPKEQNRRIYASVVNPEFLPDSSAFGFENHLNVFHCRKRGISKEVAYGLAAFLNSTAVDQYFRRFNGHTQVNVTDLKKLKYPNLKTLKSLGVWAINNKNHTQELIDGQLENLV